ncbi:MAG: hypothetical protein ACI4UX_04780, partial [Clostridia bacterium]
RKKEKMNKQNKNGITLIALIITIIVMLILVGVTVTVVINGGLIGDTKSARKQTEIATEKEIIDRAQTLVAARNKRRKLTVSTFEPALKDEAENRKTSVSDAGDIIEVLFEDTNRYYEIDKSGNIKGPFEIINDEHAGDLTKGGRCDGSEEKPYEINCIEDLVILANRTNGTGNYINEKGEVKDAVAVSHPFINKNFIITRNLNFESKYSYAKPEMKWSYDSENDAYKIDESSEKTLKELITDKSGVGFVPISPDTGSDPKMFKGNLDGQGYIIQNLYQNRTSGNAGLFRSMYGSTIKNLTLTGNINAQDKLIGVFSYIASKCKFYNCHSEVDINSKSGCGIASQIYGDITIINCYNRGNGFTGGLTGFDDVGGTTTIVNCYNTGEIKGKSGPNTAYSQASGIIRGAYTSKTNNIINTCSLGKVTNYGNNFYYVWGGAEVKLENCFYPASMTKENSKITVNEGSTSFDESNVEEILNQLNTYVKEHKNDYEVPLKEWKLEIINGEKMPVLVD